PANETRAHSSCDTNFPGHPNIRKPRIGRFAGAAESRRGAPRAQTGRKAGGDQLPLAGRPHREGCAARGGPQRNLPAADKKAAGSNGRGDRFEPAFAQRQAAGRGENFRFAGRGRPRHQTDSRLRVGQEEEMFNGTMIDELMAAVARAEETAEAELRTADPVFAMPLPE